MPDISDIIQEKMARLQSVPDEMITAADAAQLNMLKRAEALLAQMDIVDGKFVFNDKNLQLIESISNELSGSILDNDYLEALTNFAKEFNVQGQINNQYFSKIIPDFEVQSIYTKTLQISQKNAVELLSQDAITSQIIAPIKNSLLSAVTNGGSFADVMVSIRESATNTENSDGVLSRYVKRVAYDSFAVGDRQYTKIISEDLQIVFYKYQGGELSDTRCFCDERHGNYYHKHEIQDWGEGKNVGDCGGNWQGRNANTNKDTIFSFCGGYNCKHSLLPIIISRVPKQWIDRAIKLGYYKK